MIVYFKEVEENKKCKQAQLVFWVLIFAQDPPPLGSPQLIPIVNFKKARNRYKKTINFFIEIYIFSKYI